MAADNVIVVLNAGSSSLKFQAFVTTLGTLVLRLRGGIEGIGSSPHFIAKDGDGELLADIRLDAKRGGTAAACMAFLSDWLPAVLGAATIVGVGHRVVHGGSQFRVPVLVDQGVLTTLESFTPLAPLHQPHNLAPMRTLLESQPSLPQS